jgi:hypothetical protein
VLDMGKGSAALLEATLGGSLAEARAIYTGGESTVADNLGTNPEPTKTCEDRPRAPKSPA